MSDSPPPPPPPEGEAWGGVDAETAVGAEAGDGAEAEARAGAGAWGDTDALARLIARARGVDGHPPFSDGALAELATGSRELLWIDTVAAAVRTIGGGITEAEFVVDPDARRQGHGRAMLHRLLSEAPGEVLLWAHGGHPAARRLAAQHGLEPVRELLQLRRVGGLGGANGVSIRPLGYSTDVDALLEVNARAFAEHPEQGRLSRAEFDAIAAEPWFDADDVLLLWENAQLIGFCWLKVEGGSGEFYVVGVDPARQGEGWGRELVRAGLARLASRGIQKARLYVEADNAAALRLYREFGFTEHSIDIQYRWASGPWE